MVNIRVAKVGSVPEIPEGKECVPTLPNEDPVVVKALAFLIPFLEKYANGSIEDRHTLKKMVTQEFKKLP